MKRIILIVFLMGLIMSCKKEYLETSNYRGSYYTTSIEWSSPIDLAGSGNCQTSILNQLLSYSWRGGLSSSPAQFENNHISSYTDYTFALVLYLPFPDCDINRSIQGSLKKGVCHTFVNKYTIYFNAYANGTAVINKVNNCNNDSYDCYENHRLYFTNNNELIFEADGYFYDWATEKLQDGHIKVRLKKTSE